METPNNTPVNDLPYIKLTKNTRGYTWDIKIIGLDVEALKKKNEEMEDKFGNTLIVGASKYGNDE